MRKDDGIVNQRIIKRCSQLIKKCWMPLAILMIIMAIFFSLFRALTPWAKQYKGDVEQHLSLLIGQPVVINSMETSWYWFEPVLKLNQVTVLDSQDHVLKLTKLLVGINLLSSLWHWHIQPGILYVDDVHLTLRQVDDHWQIDGLRQDKQVTNLDPEVYLPVLSWLLRQQKIIIKNISALVHLNDGTLLPFSALNLTAINNNGHYRLKGEAKLAQTMATELLILADMELNPSSLSKVSGHAYLSVRRFLPTQWQMFFPEAPYHLGGGKGDIEVWLDVLNGQVSGVQTQLDFRRIVWNKNGNPKNQFIQLLQANLAWKTTSDGWQLSGDQIKLRANGLRWPENALLIDYQRSQHNYSMFIKSLLLEPLLTAEIEWPEIMQPVLAIHPRGQLQDMQINVKDDKVDYVLSRFDGLSWQGQNGFPAVRNISGVLNWQPTEGRLELDGENTTIAPKGLPPVTFAEANAAFEWKEISQGLRISMEHLVLRNSDVVVSARGALDEPFSPDSRNLRLSAEFSAEHAEQWLAYIPVPADKPKLNEWLKHDIKRIDKASGQLTIDGPLADFPFDERQQGEFTVVSRLSGMDLLFNKKWPLINDIDVYVNADKRSLDVDVRHASLLGIEATQANLHMDDIGLDRETLLLHGKVEVPAKEIKDYIFATPLRKHLAKLKLLDINGLVGLDLNLEIPLYPENDDILARGALAFNNNQMMFHHALNDLQLTHLSGSLQFDEHGVNNSELKARLLGEPVAMHLQSVRQPKPYTEIKIEGDTDIDLLREKVDLPIFSFMEGHLEITSTLTLTDDPNDLDNMKISSSLKGVSIDMPFPLGKSAEESVQLALNVDFNPDKGARLRINYGERLSSDLWFAGSKGSFRLEKGETRLGAGQASFKKEPGLQVVGSLPVFDVQQWRDVWSKLNTHPSASLIAGAGFVDLKLGDVIIWGKKYPKVALKANKISKDEWSVKFDQQDIAGDLRYQQASNSLSGRFLRLYLPKPSLLSHANKTPPSNLKPLDIPNLNVTVDTFKLGEVVMGDVDLKSTSTEANWHLEYCKIKSPDYLLTMKGDWSRQEEKNNTKLQLDLQISNLAHGLERWKITPVVDTHKGNVQVNGAWPGTITDFSLANTSGDVYMIFKNGQITHLSRETEEKLGLGKLLSILSLQTIPRRLKLDFSDLSNAGYSYDVLKGNFSLKKGVLNTTNSYIDGPVAYASMKGDLDLAKQLYDVDLHISPHIMASLPIVATIAGGPIAGMAAWVASKIINQGMQQVTGYTYKISGPWLNPVVQQVSIYKKKITKVTY